MKLYIIRHAEPDYEHHTITERGKKEAAALGKRYNASDFDEIYCSPLERAQMTCKAVTKGKGKVHTVEWLRELNHYHAVLKNGKKQTCWDFKPEYILKHPELLEEKASERIVDLAFNQAIKRNEEREKTVKNGKIGGKPLVTCVHKANVLKTTDGLFKKAFYDVAANYPNINTNDYYIDATAMYLLTKPQEFDVIVTTNLFGDILSDESAGLVGGLGLVPSGNIGDKHGLFEPVHGSAPDIASKNISNPIAMTLSVAMMLEYLDEIYLANKVKLATEKVLEKGKVLTPDLGGNAKTMDVANEIIKEIKLLN